MRLVDQSLEAVRSAVKRFKKLPLASKAGVSDNILRNVHDADWNPRAATLRKLEGAALSLEQKHGDGPASHPRESAAPNPTRGRARR